MKNLFLIGFMGVGKTFLGYVLSKYFIKYLFIDIDYIITYIYNCKIKNFYYKNKFFIFRKLEKNFLNLLRFKKLLIISCGGGVILNKINILRIETNNFCYCIMLNKIYLSININKNNRPILKKNFFKIINKRKDFYKISSNFYLKNSLRYEKFLYRFINTL